MLPRRITGFVFLFASTTLAQTPLGTAFTYQGQLKSGGNPASGGYTMVFTMRPRRQRWSRPFRFEGPRIIGRPCHGRGSRHECA